MKLRNKALIALLGAGLAGGPAIAKSRVETVETRPERLGPAPCVTGPEVEALALVMMPEALTAVAQACSGSLPESALLRRTGAPFFERYRAQSAPSMARAQTAFAKISGQANGKDVSEIGLDMMKAMVVPMLTEAVEAKDCGAINHMIELLEPLPPENLAGMISTILQLVARKEADSRQKIETTEPETKSSPNICPFPEAP